MTVATVRAAIADACATVTGLRSSTYIPDQVNPPVAVVGTVAFDPRLVLGEGKCARNIQVTVYLPRTAEASSQKFADTLTELSGSGSLIVALQTNAGLLALVDYLTVTEVRGPLVGTVGAVEYLIYEFDTEVVF